MRDRALKVYCEMGLRQYGADGSLKAMALSTDHKVEQPSERERLTAAGGHVSEARVEEGTFVPARLYQDGVRPWLGPGLCISRAFGDLDSTCCGVIATPEVRCHHIGAEPEPRP